MIPRIAKRWNAPAGVLALVSVLCAAGAAHAGEKVLIKNDTEVAVVVNLSTVVGGKVIREKPVLIAPGKAAIFSVPGNMVVQISDAKQGGALYSGIIPAATADQTYSLQMDGAKAKLEKK